MSHGTCKNYEIFCTLVAGNKDDSGTIPGTQPSQTTKHDNEKGRSDVIPEVGCGWPWTGVAVVKVKSASENHIFEAKC